MCACTCARARARVYVCVILVELLFQLRLRNLLNYVYVIRTALMSVTITNYTVLITKYCQGF